MAALSHRARVVAILTFCCTMSVTLHAAEPTQSLDERQAATLQELERLLKQSPDLVKRAHEVHDLTAEHNRQMARLDRGLETLTREDTGALIVMATPGTPDQPHYRLAKRSLDHLQALVDEKGVKARIVLHITDTTPVDRQDWKMILPTDENGNVSIWCSTVGGAVPKEILQMAVERLATPRQSVPERDMI